MQLQPIFEAHMGNTTVGARALEESVLHVGMECREHCPLGPECPSSNYCGRSGACCRKGLAHLPCDGTMGCEAQNCCVAIPPRRPPALPPAPKPSPAPLSPSPSPPVSECMIERISYEVVRFSRDAVGDKKYEVAVHIEPWQADSIVWLNYKQMRLSGEQELPIRIIFISGATIDSDDSAEEGDVTFRKIGLKLSDGKDASLKDCEFDDVRTGVAGHIKEQSGSLRSGRGSAPGSPQPAHIRRMQSEEARDEQLVVSATECRRGTIKLWSYGEVGRDLIRIGCHLPFQPPPELPSPPPPPMLLPPADRATVGTTRNEVTLLREAPPPPPSERLFERSSPARIPPPSAPPPGGSTNVCRSGSRTEEWQERSPPVLIANTLHWRQATMWWAIILLGTAGAVTSIFRASFLDQLRQSLESFIPGSRSHVGMVEVPVDELSALNDVDDEDTHDVAPQDVDHATSERGKLLRSISDVMEDCENSCVQSGTSTELERDQKKESAKLSRVKPPQADPADDDWMEVHIASSSRNEAKDPAAKSEGLSPTPAPFRTLVADFD